MYVDRLRGDIGVFGEHEGSHGRHVLVSHNQKADQKETEELIRKLKGDQEARFEVL